jgi:hypothetical protein
MNDQNLLKGKATQFRSGEMAASNGRKGGLAKKRNADLVKEHAAVLLEILMSEGLNGQTIQENMDRGLIRIVINREQGAVAAYEKIMEYAGKSPTLQLKKEEQKLRRDELKLKQAELELKKAQAVQRSGDMTDIEDLTPLAELLNEPDTDD